MIVTVKGQVIECKVFKKDDKTSIKACILQGTDTVWVKVQDIVERGIEIALDCWIFPYVNRQGAAGVNLVQVKGLQVKG